MKKVKNFFLSFGLMIGIVLFNASQSIASQFTMFAVTQNPVTGRMKGKFANAVFATQFGKNTMRSKALEVRNPKTAPQQNNRSIFSTAVLLGGSFLQIVKIGFQKVAIGMSPYNHFVGITAKDALSGVVGAIVITWANIKISAGTLMGVIGQSCSENMANLVTSWTNNSGAGDALATDKAYVIYYNTTLNQSIMTDGSDTRSDTATSILKPALWASTNVIHVYGFFKSADGQLISDSAYFGTFVLA